MNNFFDNYFLLMGRLSTTSYKYFYICIESYILLSYCYCLHFEITMKNEEEHLDTGFLMDFENPELYVPFQCCKNNEALQYCINNNCSNENPFICGTKRCPCRHYHQQCLKADIEYTIHKIKQKIVNPQNVIENLSSRFDNLIDNLSQFRDHITQKINSMSPQLNTTRLSHVEKIFISSVEKLSSHKFIPKQTSKIWNDIKQKNSQKSDIFTQITTQIDKFHLIVQQQKKLIQKKIKNIFQKQRIIDQSANSKLTVQAAFKLDSSILNDSQQIELLSKMFPKKIDQVKLLYKASEHDFSMAKFYELCGDITRTMLICRTKMDKIIGGYTPIKFASQLNQKNRGFIPDNTGESFMFSLTENDKFKLERKHQAIYRDPNKLELTYGNVDLELCDHADKVNKSSTFLRNKAYINAKYQDNQESFKKFTGSNDIHFMTKEWQVWKIVFSSEEGKEQPLVEEENDFGLMGLFDL